MRIYAKGIELNHDCCRIKISLPKLENLGYKVRMSGRGNVIKNYKVNSTKKSIEVELI